ncbi:hypothetical protein FXO37_27347 [Capsicum annuum]|nr:hypothetical protein FXO37_27347 [Capsicum annuum]
MRKICLLVKLVTKLVLVLEYTLSVEKKQDVLAQSIAEAEYIASTLAVNQALWIQKLLADLYMEQKKSTEILVDNKDEISIANNHVSHGKIKHFNIKLSFLKEMQMSGDINMVHCRSDF